MNGRRSDFSIHFVILIFARSLLTYAMSGNGAVHAFLQLAGPTSIIRLVAHLG